MAANFVHLGQRWVNVEQVLRVEFVSDPSNPAQIGVARIPYASGQSDSFRLQTEIEPLLDWLKQHQAS